MDAPAATIARPPASLRRTIGAARLVHPFPSLLAAAATAALAFVAAGGTPGGSVVLRMVIMMLAAQFAIGATNDLFDRKLDAATKPWKPIAAGYVSEHAAIAVALLCLSLTVVLAATFSTLAFGLAMLGTACGFAYDARLKRSALSALPFMIAIPVLPLFVWAAMDEWRDALWWLLAPGALLGLSVHLSNQLPDIEDDMRHGVMGLPHHLGVERSKIIAQTSLATALAMSLLPAIFISYDWRVYVPGVAVGAASLAALVVLHRSRDARSQQIAFGVTAIGAVCVAVGWLAAVT